MEATEINYPARDEKQKCPYCIEGFRYDGDTSLSLDDAEYSCTVCSGNGIMPAYEDWDIYFTSEESTWHEHQAMKAYLAKRGISVGTCIEEQFAKQG